MLPTNAVLITRTLGHMSDDGPATTHHADDSDVPAVIGEDVGWAPTWSAASGFDLLQTLLLFLCFQG